MRGEIGQVTPYQERQRTGYVALFDVLGFSDRVMRNGVKGLNDYVGPVLSLASSRPGVEAILFSDTVVFYTLDDEPASFDALVQASSELFHMLLVANVPIRGAIAHGEFLASELGRRGTVIAGRPLIEAHHFEQQLQWIGVMIAPSVRAHVPNLHERWDLAAAKRSDLPGDRFVDVLNAVRVRTCSEIPLESTLGHMTAYEGLAVVPVGVIDKPDVGQIMSSLDKVIAKLDWLKQLAPEARSQAKYQRSVVWLRKVRSSIKRLE